MWPITIGITDEMRTEQRDRFEAGGSLGQPRKCPPESLQRGCDHPFRLRLDISLIQRIVNCTFLSTVDFVLLLNGPRLYASEPCRTPNPGTTPSLSAYQQGERP
jgi:hypothetical protein